MNHNNNQTGRKLAVTERDKQTYVLKTKQDERILLACKRLEQQHLSKRDRHLIRLIKSQLLDDWRTPLEKEVKRVARRKKVA